MIKAIVFDCFGVLVSEGWNAFRDTYFPEGQRRQAALDLRREADRGLISNDEFEQGVADMAGVSLEFARTYLRDNVANEPLFAYIKQGLKPRFRIGMLSNAAVDWLDRLFSAEQRALFDAMILSFEIGSAKPDARAFEVTCERLGVGPTECLFIDDTDRFCEAARELGMQAILYRDFPQCKAEIEQILKGQQRTS